MGSNTPKEYNGISFRIKFIVSEIGFIFNTKIG